MPLLPTEPEMTHVWVRGWSELLRVSPSACW